MNSDPTWLFQCPRALLVAAALSLVACSNGGNSGVHAPFVAYTADGAVRAVERDAMRSYFGIPYAAPPVGNLRWAPPASPAKWDTLANTGSNPPCLQTSSSPFRLSNGQEDCLYLDVHAPTSEGPFPVMVWFHGGAFNTGGVTTYSDPSPLVSKGVIVVNVAYRIGAMGFLGHPTLEADGTGVATAGSVGNYGIMDQIAALRWVQNNITAFGGDRNNVTIFGESAGGYSVMTHLASTLSAGLFHKAIVQSGGYAFDRQLSKATLETTSTTVVNNALTAAGVTCPGGTVTASCLRGLSTSVVSNQLATAFNSAMSSPVPSIDGYVLTQSIKATFQAGTNNKVPLMNGTNEDEWGLFLAIGEIARRAAVGGGSTDPTNLSYLASSSGTALTSVTYGATMAAQAAGSGLTSATLTAAYPLSSYGGSSDLLSPVRATMAQGSDFIFSCPAWNVSNRAVTQATTIYMYEFRDQTALASVGVDSDYNATIATPQGAAHSYELQYLFNLRNLRNQERSDLQDSMTRYWANFARTGNPNNGSNTVSVTWPAFTGNGASDVLGLDVASGGGVTVLTTSYDTAHKCSSLYSMLSF